MTHTLGTVTCAWTPTPSDAPAGCRVERGTLFATWQGGIGAIHGPLAADLVQLVQRQWITIAPVRGQNWHRDAIPEEEDDPPFRIQPQLTLAIAVTSAGKSMVTSDTHPDLAEDLIHQVVRSSWRRCVEEVRRPSAISGLAHWLARVERDRLRPETRLLLAMLPELAAAKTPAMLPLLRAIPMGAPSQHGDITIIPLLSKGQTKRSYDVLTEAIAAHRIEVRELPEGPTVPWIQMTVSGAKPVLVCAGEVLQGLKQHRVVCHSILVRGQVRLAVACVERLRWGQDQALSATFRAPPSIRAAVGDRGADQQGRVWSMVGRHLERTGRGNPTDSLAEALRDVAGNEAPKLPYDCRGVIILRRGRFTGAEVFDCPEVLAQAWPQLWAGWQVDDRRGSGGGVPATVDDLFMGLSESELASAPGDGIPLGLAGWSRDDDRLTGVALVKNDVVLHCSLAAVED